jgi:hypothetical protein
MLTFILCLASRLAAQGGCPSVPQLSEGSQRHRGFQNGAAATIYVVGVLGGSGGSNPSGLQQITNAANKWTLVSGSTVSFNVQSVQSVPSGNSSPATPVIIYQYGDPSYFVTGGICAGGDACVPFPQLDAQGHTELAVVYVNPTQWPSDSYFEIEMDHEMGHAGYGLGDCPGCDTLATIVLAQREMEKGRSPLV